MISGTLNRKRDAVQIGSQLGNLRGGMGFRADLYQIDASIDHLFGHLSRIQAIYIA